MPNIDAMDAADTHLDCRFRFLQPGEGHVLSEAIRVAYGESYDVRWVYDEAEVNSRLQAGTYVSCVAESPEGDLLCHEGMSLAAAGDAVAHSGQAVTMPAARGQHLFTRTKKYLMDWAKEQGLAGMFSEATAAHPYSQKANIDLGAHETGFLLGWIPASVVQRRCRRARSPSASPRRSSTPSSTTGTSGPFMLRPGTGTSSDGPSSSPSCVASLPTRRRNPSARAHRAARRDKPRPQPRRHHDHVPGPTSKPRCRRAPPPLPQEEPGCHLLGPPAREPRHGPRRRPARAPWRVLRGIFPNRRADGDVLRMQSMHRVRFTAGDVGGRLGARKGAAGLRLGRRQLGDP